MHEPPKQNVVPETSSGPLQIPEEQQALFRELLSICERKALNVKCVTRSGCLRRIVTVFLWISLQA
jgi:hypothetical protein